MAGDYVLQDHFVNQKVDTGLLHLQDCLPEAIPVFTSNILGLAQDTSVALTVLRQVCCTARSTEKDFLPFRTAPLLFELSAKTLLDANAPVQMANPPTLSRRFLRDL